MLLSGPAQAIDSVETWDSGATDVEFYTGLEDLALRPQSDTSLYADMLLGYGISDRLSAYLGLTLHADGQFMGNSDLYQGLFSTLLDSEHFDLDLLLSFALQDGSFVVAPATELNFDMAADLQKAGLYLRFSLPCGAKEDAALPSLHLAGFTGAVHADLTLGAYWTLPAQQQLLLEFKIGHSLSGLAAQSHAIALPWSRAMALGYNKVLSDRLELISQVEISAHQLQQAVRFAAMFGFIATLPAN